MDAATIKFTKSNAASATVSVSVVGIPNRRLIALVNRCHAVSLDPVGLCAASVALKSGLVYTSATKSFSDSEP